MIKVVLAIALGLILSNFMKKYVIKHLGFLDKNWLSCKKSVRLDKEDAE